MGRPDRPAVIQKRGYEVGNFINCTPAIRAVAEVLGRRVDVFFETPAVAELVRDADFITPILKRPENGRVILTTFRSHRDAPERPDWLDIYDAVGRRMYGHHGPCPMTYVDRPSLAEVGLEELEAEPYAAIVRGAASQRWHRAKDPGDAVYYFAAMTLFDDYAIRSVLAGGPNDARWWGKKMAGWFDHIRDETGNGLRKALAIVANAELVVANDTGLYHAAAALGRPTFVFWKRTRFEKNRAPGASVTYGHESRWVKALAVWLKAGRQEEKTG